MCRNRIAGEAAKLMSHALQRTQLALSHLSAAHAIRELLHALGPAVSIALTRRALPATGLARMKLSW